MDEMRKIKKAVAKRLGWPENKLWGPNCLAWEHKDHIFSEDDPVTMAAHARAATMDMLPMSWNRQKAGHLCLKMKC